MILRRIFSALLVFIFGCGSALPQTSQTRAQIEAYISTHVLDNNVGAITPAIMRTALLNQAASTQTLLDLYSARSLYCNPTGSSAAPQSCTLAQLLFNATLAGAVPASGGGISKFLRADGTWALPAGGGGGARIQMDLLAVTAPNTLSALSQPQSGGLAEILVNGQGLPDSGASPCFSVSGTAVTWSATNCGYALATNDYVAMIYSY